jgi:deoxyhypusine synthase
MVVLRGFFWNCSGGGQIMVGCGSKKLPGIVAAMLSRRNEKKRALFHRVAAAFTTAKVNTGQLACAKATEACKDG